VSENRKAFKMWRSPDGLDRGVQKYKTAKKQTAATGGGVVDATDVAKKQTAATGGGVVDATDVAKKYTSLVANTGGKCEICKTEPVTKLTTDNKRFYRTLYFFYRLSEQEQFTVDDLQDSGGQQKIKTLTGYLKLESDITGTNLSNLNDVIRRCAADSMPPTWEAWKKGRRHAGMCCPECWNKQCKGMRANFNFNFIFNFSFEISQTSSSLKCKNFLVSRLRKVNDNLFCFENMCVRTGGCLINPKAEVEVEVEVEVEIEVMVVVNSQCITG
jgi:hypothetical protein